MILCLVIENGIDFIKCFKELTISFLFSCSGFSSNNLNIKAVCRMRYSNHRFLKKMGFCFCVSELQIIKNEKVEKKNPKGVNLIIEYVYYQKNTINKVTEIMALLHVSEHLQRSTLITIYKLFIRPYFDYWDFIYNQAYSNSFHQMLETIQCTFALAIKEAFLCLQRN